MDKNWTREITPALKMLKARGGALDLKAAELIEALWSTVSNAGPMNVEKARERHEDLKGLVEENRQLRADVAFLAQAESKALRENATLRIERRSHETIRQMLGVAMEERGGDKWRGLGLADLVQILIAEWRGARHEMEAVQGRRKYKLADLLLDERSSISDDFVRGAQWSPDQVASLEALRQATKAAMIPVLKEAGMIDD